MRIRWRRFERSMHLLLRKYDACRRMTLWQRFIRWSAADIVVPAGILTGSGAAIAILAIIGLWPTIEPNNSVWLGVLGLSALITASARAGIIQQISAVNPEYLTLWFLPLTPLEIARIILRRMLVNLAILFSLVALVYGVMSIHGGIPIAAGLLCALLQTLASLALSGLIVALEIPPNAHAIFTIFFGIFSVWTASDASMGPGVQAAATILNPFAWINSFYVETFVKHAPGGWRSLAASLGLIATLP